MAHDKHGHFQIFEKARDPLEHSAVQTRGRLVEQQNTRAHGENRGERDEALLAVRQLVGDSILVAVQAKLQQRFGDNGLDGRYAVGCLPAQRGVLLGRQRHSHVLC